jgi:ABC-type transporter lipoprotein component MlaA
LDECLDEYTFLRDAYYQHRAFQFNCCDADKELEGQAMLEGPPE